MHDDAGMQAIQGQRITLRPWQRGDTLAQEQWPRYTEPFSSLWNIPRSISYNDFGWSAQRYAWAVEDRARRLIGRISLREIAADRSSARLGISLAQPYVGQGLGSEALELFLDYFFGPLGFARMYLDVAAFNRRAVRCYEQLGFHHLGSEWRGAGNDPSIRLLDEPRFADLRPHFRRGRYEAQVEFYEMALDQGDWRARR